MKPFGYSPDLDAFCKKIVCCAAAELILKGDLCPQSHYCYLDRNGKFSTLPVAATEQFFTKEENKSKLPFHIAFLWNIIVRQTGFNLQAVVFVHDTWMAPSDGRGVPPSQHPERKSVIMFNVYFPDRADGYLVTYAVDSAGSIEVDDPKCMKVMPGFWLSDLFPRLAKEPG